MTSAINKDIVPVQAIWPVGMTGATDGDVISLKNYARVDIMISVGASPGGTTAVTVKKGTVVSAATVALAFTRFLRSGFRVNHGGASNQAGFTVGEVITGGTSNATGVVVVDTGSYLLMHTSNGTAFQAAETLTGGTSLYTATSSSVTINEDIMLDAVASSNTFTIPAVANMKYIIPVDDSLTGSAYDTVKLALGAPSAGTITLDAQYLLSGARYGSEPSETAIYD